MEQNPTQLNLRKINLPFSKRLKIIAIQVSESEPKIYNHGNNQINEQSYVPSEMKTRPPQPQNETINVKYWQTSCPLFARCSISEKTIIAIKILFLMFDINH